MVYNEDKAQIVHKKKKEGFFVSIGNKLKELRGNKSQETIANEIGITKSSWSMYERGERTPRDEVKIRIANYFNKSVQELFFGQ